MRAVFTLILACGVALAGCSKAAEEPKGPTKGEVYAKLEAPGRKQLENLRAVLELACEQPPIAVADLAKPVEALPVSDIALNRTKEEHTGNARMFLLSRVIPSRADAKTLGAEAIMARIQRLGLPTPPTGFHPGSFNEIFTRSARFLKEPPGKDAEKEYFPAYREMVEEFVSLKYLLLLRTLAIKQSRQLEPGVVTPGIYGGQLLVYDLPGRKLLGALPVATANQEGKKVKSVGYDLAAEVESQVDQVLAAAQKKAAP